MYVLSWVQGNNNDGIDSNLPSPVDLEDIIFY